MLMTPEKSKERLRVKGFSSRNLFNTNDSRVEVSPDISETSEEKANIQQINKMDKQTENRKSEFKKVLIKCKHNDCSREFTTTFGFQQHLKKEHGDLNFKMGAEVCNICGKSFLYIDKHMKAVHSSMIEEEICDICGKAMRKGMKKHRGLCIFCPFCGKEERKRLRLLKHIKDCEKVRRNRLDQMVPLDLSSPVKLSKLNEELNLRPMIHPKMHQDPPKPTHTQPGDPQRPTQTHSNTPRPTETHHDHQHRLNEMSEQKQKNLKDISDDRFDRELQESITNAKSKDDLDKPRKKYPFDKYNDDEDYMSELEELDEKEFTKNRREIKDKLELNLRDIDKLVNKAKTGDEIVVEKFRTFMESISNVRKDSEDLNQITQPSTVGLYTRAIQNDLLPVLHELYEPFDSRWLFDCTTDKQCTYEGESRLSAISKEPVYLTPRILRKALAKYNETESGHQRSMLLAATAQFMKFIELEFSEKISIWGREPLDNIVSYHNSVKVCIESSKLWKTCNKDRRDQLKNNQVLKDMENPNHEAEKLESYKKYLTSSERLKQIEKIAYFAKKETRKPTDSEFVECTKIVMGEVVLVNGCRPVVVYRLPVGAYSNKKPGFNPDLVSKNGSVLEEVESDTKLHKRLNPNLPPKHLACKHQIENKSATCQENCKDKCEPDGFNIFCTWDKTRDTNGPSYLHLPGPTTELLDLYDIIKSKYFKEITLHGDPDWLNNESTPFFLNTYGSPYSQLKLTHLSQAMGIDVTAYDFRRIVATWALSHESEEIRNAESETLRHGNKVAYDHYVQNKEVKPQTLIQTYVEEEGIIPDKIRNVIKDAENRTKLETSEIEKTRHKKHHASIIDKKQRVQKLRLENKPLGPTHRILESDKIELKAIIEELTGESIRSIVKKSNATKWRQFIVRLLCKTSGALGDNLRSLWKKIYKGDLKYGVRDMRFKAQEKGWPRQKSVDFLQGHDRNTFIAGTVFRALKLDVKNEERKSYIQ